MKEKNKGNDKNKEKIIRTNERKKTVTEPESDCV
jgi:hypothetical protein